jgi:DNA-binding XRE family transcriptional regulator
MTMFDVRCSGCGKRYGFAAEAVTACPPCPRCHAGPDRSALEADQAKIDEFREFLREWKDRGRLNRPGRIRVAAGLSFGQAVRLLGVDAQALRDIEAGRAEPSADLAAKMAETYGVA